MRFVAGEVALGQVFSPLMYSKIPLIRFALDRTCAKLSNTPDYQMLPLLT